MNIAATGVKVNQVLCQNYMVENTDKVLVILVDSSISKRKTIICGLYEEKLASVRQKGRSLLLFRCSPYVHFFCFSCASGSIFAFAGIVFRKLAKKRL